MLFARAAMLRLFRQLGGTLKGNVNGQPFRFKPAINKHGDLYVTVYKGRSTKAYHSLPLDEWVEWAHENVIALGA